MKRLRRLGRWTSSRLPLAALLLSPLMTTEAAEFKLGERTFTVPDGFVVERIAGSPLVDRPIVGSFDEQGRLYVADSSGSNAPVKQQVEERTHRIVRLEDSNGDGKFDRSTVFADRMMFPEGALWYAGSLYVSAPPSIWKLTDADGDGVADTRTEWFQGKTLTGCANDLHGPYLGLDGWIYWCKGAFAEQTYPRPGKKPLVTTAAHIFRCRPDGTGIEPVMTGGMDNPVDVVFTPEGERIFSTTFLQNPGGGHRDGLIHAIYGGLYGKVHDVTDNHPHTSPDLMPVLSHLGPAAPSGLTTYDGTAFGPEYRNDLFTCLFNLRKVTRHTLTPSGATYSSKDEDFLVSPNLDFHPTDVFEDADGSLVVIDTGGWYKLCCPTSQLSKPDVLGGIYRVRRKDAPAVSDPRGLKIAWDSSSAGDLAKLLADPRPAVRKRAIETLGRKGPEAVKALEPIIQGDSGASLKRDAIWTATRIDGPEARALVREAAGQTDASVRHAAIHSISVRNDRDAAPLLARALNDSTPAVRRTAAEALGRVGDASFVPAILKALEHPSDRIIDHSLVFALIEIDDPRATTAGLASTSPSVRRGALIAIDQMDGGKLKPEEVVRELSGGSNELKETAAWVLARHPDWGTALVGVLGKKLDQPELPPDVAQETARLLARFASNPPIQELIADRLLANSTTEAQRGAVLQAMALSKLKAVPPRWVEGLAKALGSADVPTIRGAVATARALPLAEAKAEAVGKALIGIADNASIPAEVRLDALAAMPQGPGQVSPSLFAFLREQLQGDRPVITRRTAADVLAKGQLSPEQVASLCDDVKTAGPLELDRLLGAFERSTDEALGLRLVAALKESPGLTSFRPDALRPRLAKFGEPVQREAEALYRTINVDIAKQSARLESMLATVTGGDVRRGQEVFNGSKAACVTCHAIGYVGGHVGPDLTRVGQIRTERDLLEAIVFPSASFVRSFEPLTVATKDGKVHNGIPRKDTSEEVLLATGPNEEVRIPRDDIEDIRPGTVSVMPAGLEQQLSSDELADLIAFLRACR
ncbi:PVC-type heme-binding CxxCH protein [Singulisphaera sp. PoT]|uniref:PVC-type heme-binding CxxCH protein n=1 Tax=Singulisphaera sp. PoT TaxID=3411797 RepID=UPI003BF4F43C